MKSIRCKLAGLIVLSLVAASPGFATGLKTVTVINNTSYVMTAFYDSPSSSTDWNSANLLTPLGQTVSAGQSLSINVLDASDSCTYDFMAVLDGSTQYAYTYSVDVCSGTGSWTISDSQ